MGKMHPLGTLGETKWQNAQGSVGQNSSCLPFIMYFTHSSDVWVDLLLNSMPPFQSQFFCVGEAFFAAIHFIVYHILSTLPKYTQLFMKLIAQMLQNISMTTTKHGTLNFSSNFEVVYTQFL